MRVYQNFEELDKDLNILDLKRQVHWQETKKRWNDSKSNFISLPVIGNTVGLYIGRLILMKVIRMIIGR